MRFLGYFLRRKSSIPSGDENEIKEELGDIYPDPVGHVVKEVFYSRLPIKFTDKQREKEIIHYNQRTREMGRNGGGKGRKWKLK